MNTQIDKINKVFRGIMTLIIGAFLFSIAFTGTQTTAPTAGVKSTNPHAVTASVSNYQTAPEKPKYSYFIRDLELKPKISAESFIVGDLDTGEIILLKNQDNTYPIASLSKLMTALVATELNGKDETAKVSRGALATEGRNGNFWAGEEIKVSDILYPLLMSSSNDAAEIIAENFERDTFLRKMDLQAKKIKMMDTHFDDPSGLSEKNTSNVLDLFKLTGYIRRQKPELLDITLNRRHSAAKHTWFSNNQFLSEDEYTGGKSGYLNEAKQTVISTFEMQLGEENGPRPIGIVLLRSNDRYRDVMNILKYLKSNVYYGGEEGAMADWIKEDLELPAVRDPDYVTLTFLGDMMLDRGVESSVMKNFGGDYSELFAHLEELKDSDIVFANLEGPASDKGEDLGNLYSFRMHPWIIPALKSAGIDIVSVANNHAGDWGREAFVDTLLRLRENEILYAGGGTKEEIKQPTIIEKYDMKIGFLAFSDVGPSWMEATNSKVGVALAYNPQLEEIISNAANQVDHLVVSFHWGEEYKEIHNSRQEELAHKVIDAGATLVIGHHPHVAQDTEKYKNGYIAYSLGNFIFDQYFSKETMQGMMLQVKIHRDKSLKVQKNTVKLNKIFQPYKVLYGKEIKYLHDPELE
jgi:D-alanyl-D-alanine carboxypeptidase